MTEPENVPKFPATTDADDDEVQFRRVKEEAERLANQSEAERTFFMPKRAEVVAVSVATLKSAVTAVLRERAMRTAAEQLEKECERNRQEQERLAKERKEREDARKRQWAQKQEKREQQHAKNDEERDQKRLAKMAEREERRAEREAERKSNEKAKGLRNIMRLPVARHDKELRRLAERLGGDEPALRQEFDELLGVGGGEASTEKVEAWPEPVDTTTLLQECSDKICRYVVLQEHQQTAAVLWTAHAWLYDHNVLTHSPILAATSAEPDSGKSTLVAVGGHGTPRFSLNIEMTGPSLYRHVDAVKPTLVLDEADDLFTRRSDLKHIMNAGWTRGAKIARQVNIGGVWVTAYFNPFTPKAISLLGRNLPQATRTRCIELRMLPKRADEKVEPFDQIDDAEFAVLRRKAARWAADNAPVVKDAKPTMAVGLNNRAAANWKSLLAIAELAGGSWPQRAHEAAERLTRSGRRPSDGIKLLAALKEMFAEEREEITSETVVAELITDPTSVWVDYNRGGPVTQRQVANLLDDYDIGPVSLHPTKRKDFSRQGYKLSQFGDAFARYLPADLII